MALVGLGAGVVIGWAGYKLYVYLFKRNPPIQEIIISEQATSTTNIMQPYSLSRPDEENTAQDFGSRSLVMWAGNKVLNKIADSIIVKLIKEFGAEVIEDLQQVWSCEKNNGLVSASVALVGCIVEKVFSFVCELGIRVFKILCSAWSFMKHYICELLISGVLFCDEIVFAFAFGAGVLIGVAIHKLYSYLKNSGLGNRICNFFARIFEALRLTCFKVKCFFLSLLGNGAGETDNDDVDSRNSGTNRNETENGRPFRIAEGDVTSNLSSAASDRNESRVELTEGGQPVRAADDDVTSSSGNSAVSRNFSSASSSIIRLRIIS